MSTKTNLKRVRESLIDIKNVEFYDKIFEDDQSMSDSDYSASKTESDDTYADEHISNEND